MAKSIHVRAFDRALAQARTVVKSARSDVIALTTRRKEINATGKHLASMLDKGDDMYLYMIGNKANFTVTFQDVEGFKCLKVESALWWLEMVGTVDRTRDYPDYLNREYVYVMPNGDRITLNVYVKSDSPTCRKVQIGTETVTTPKYEIRCD